jgi:hypothetical protein
MLWRITIVIQIMGRTMRGKGSWVTEVTRTERVVVEIKVWEILNEVVERVVEIGMRGQEPPRGTLRNNDSDKNSDVVQGCFDIEQFEILKKQLERVSELLQNICKVIN